MKTFILVIALSCAYTFIHHNASAQAAQKPVVSIGQTEKPTFRTMQDIPEYMPTLAFVERAPSILHSTYSLTNYTSASDNGKSPSQLLAKYQHKKKVGGTLSIIGVSCLLAGAIVLTTAKNGGTEDSRFLSYAGGAVLVGGGFGFLIPGLHLMGKYQRKIDDMDTGQ